MPFLLKIVFIAIPAIIGLGSIYFLGNDNPVEEATEEVIKEETGADIDLSPDSPEKPSKK